MTERYGHRGYMTAPAIKTTDGVLLPAASGRKSVTVSSNSPNTVNLAWSQAASATNGLTLNTAAPSWTFRREDIGNLIDTELHGIVATANSTVTIFVAFE